MHKLIPIVSLALLLACQQPCPEVTETTVAQISERTSPLAKFEPEHGQVILFAGQELEAVGANDLYSDGYMDHFDAPGGWTTYSNINPGEESFGRIQEGLDGLWDTHDWGDNDYNAMLQNNDPDYANMAMAIGLQFVNHKEKVASREHDEYIDRLGDFLLELGERPVFLRIAYEFDGDPWNHYDRESTVAAYRRIVDRLRAKGVENTAYVWQSTGFISHPDQLDAWYPGDDYVDWCGVSFFNRWREIEMFEYARKKGNLFSSRRLPLPYQTSMPSSPAIRFRRSSLILLRPKRHGKNGSFLSSMPSMKIRMS